MVYAYVPNFVSVVYSVALWWQKKNNFCHILPHFGIRHLVMLPIGSSLRKLNTGAQLQTFPYPVVSKSFLYSNAFMAKSGAQSLTFKSVTNRQTDKKTQRFWLSRWRVKLCKFFKNRARDVPLWGVYILHLDKITVKILTFWGPTAAPMGVKFGMESKLNTGSLRFAQCCQ